MALTVQTVPIDSVHPDPANAREHGDKNLLAIRTSLARFGQQKPIVVTEDGVIIAGNGMWRAAKELGWTEIVIARTALKNAEATAYSLVDNRSSDLSTWDLEMLNTDIAALRGNGFGEDELAKLGFSDEDMKDLFAKLNSGSSKTTTIEDEAPEPPSPEQTITKPGDLWILGNHRLLCGDSTKADNVAKVMNGTKANLCFTSPPYAEQRKEQYGGIEAASYWEWFKNVQENIKSVALNPNGVFVLNIKPHAHEKQRHLYVFDLVCSMVRQCGWLFVDEFCWLRTGIPQQVVNRFKNAFEPCYWFAASSDFVWYPENVMHESDNVPLALGPGAGDTNAARRQGKGGAAIQGNEIVSGMAYPSNVLDFRQNAEALGHPAAFPVILPSFFIRCMSEEKGIVYEPFLGSGTTLISAEQLNRRCFGLEIEPRYCDVIVKRWETFTGKKAVLDTTPSPALQISTSP